MSNLRALLKNRYLDTVRSVKPPNRYKIMVVDPLSNKLLSAACQTFEILEEDVTLVESIEKNRQPFKDMEAIYLLTPNEESVSLLIQDMAYGGPGGRPGSMYAAAHVFFTHALDDALFRKISSSNASIRSLKELNVNFEAFESKVFTVRMPNSFHSLFGSHKDNADRDLNIIADRIISFCSTIGENPILRYHRPASAENATNNTVVPARLATMVQRKLDEFCRHDSSFPPKRDPPRPRAIMYIFDRTVDLNTALLHEFTYQAMANDLLEIEDGVKYIHEFASGTGDASSKEVTLDESDAIWAEIRHSHIADCSNELTANFKKLIGENKVLAQMSKESTTLNDMKRILADFPQFQELKAKYSAHISIAQECVELFEKQKLLEIGKVEQDMACKMTTEGEYPKKLIDRLELLLDDDSIRADDKLRMVLLYTIYKDGLKRESRDRLQQHANFSAKDIEVLENLELLHITVNKDPKKLMDNIKLPPSRRRPDGTSYELSRYVPEIKKVLEAQVKNQVQDAIFPYTREPSPEEMAEQNKVAQPLRSARPSWQKSAQERSGPKPVTGSKLIAFIAGGVTYSEMRSVYELSKALNRDIIIGSTHIITPRRFIEDMSRLRHAPPREAVSPPRGAALPPRGAALPPRGAALPPRGAALPPRGAAPLSRGAPPPRGVPSSRGAPPPPLPPRSSGPSYRR